MAGRLPGDIPAARRKLAWTVLSALAGGVTLARAADDDEIGAQIADALKATIAAAIRAGKK